MNLYFTRGSCSIGPVTIYYGDNAMRWAWNIRVRRTWLCFRPYSFRIINWKIYWTKPYIYLSPNATPTSATRFTHQLGPTARNAIKRLPQQLALPALLQLTSLTTLALAILPGIARRDSVESVAKILWGL